MPKSTNGASDAAWVYGDERAAARYLDVSASFLAQKRVNGDGPRYFKLGRSVKYRIPHDLDVWVEKRARQHTAA